MHLIENFLNCTQLFSVYTALDFMEEFAEIVLFSVSYVLSVVNILFLCALASLREIIISSIYPCASV